MKRPVQLAGVALMLLGLAGTAKHPSPTLSLALLPTAAAAVVVTVRTIVAGRRAHAAPGGPGRELLKEGRPPRRPAVAAALPVHPARAGSSG